MNENINKNVDRPAHYDGTKCIENMQMMFGRQAVKTSAVATLINTAIGQVVRTAIQKNRILQRLNGMRII